MAVKIRLDRTGSKNQPYYRVVVIDGRSARGAPFIEIVGQYNPLADKDKFKVDKNKILDWIKKGAQPTFTVRKLLGEAKILKPIDLASLPKKTPKKKAAAAAVPAEAKAEGAPPAEAKKEGAPKKEEKKKGEKPAEGAKEAPKEAGPAGRQEKKEVEKKEKVEKKEEPKEEGKEKQSTEAQK